MQQARTRCIGTSGRWLQSMAHFIRAGIEQCAFEESRGCGLHDRFRLLRLQREIPQHGINLRIELGTQQRQQPVTDAIAGELERCIRCVRARSGRAVEARPQSRRV